MTASELAGMAAIGDEPGALAKPDMQADAFVGALARAGHFMEALRALAFALPGPAVISWAHECVRRFAAPVTDAEKAAYEAVDRWLKESSDQNRREAMEAAQAAGIGTPSGCLGAAVFFSGGSVAPIQAPDVPPVAGASAKVAVGAVALAVVSREPEKAPNKYRAAIDEGMRRATELKIW